MEGLLVNTAVGVASGAAGFGVGQIFGAVGAGTYGGVVGNEVLRGLSHGVAQGTISGITGGDFLSSFASGALGSAVGSGMYFTGIPSTNVLSFAASSLSGGGISALTGGDFMQGAVMSLFVHAFNHAGEHGGESSGESGDIRDCADCGNFGNGGGGPPPSGFGGASRGSINIRTSIRVSPNGTPMSSNKFNARINNSPTKSSLSNGRAVHRQYGKEFRFPNGKRADDIRFSIGKKSIQLRELKPANYRSYISGRSQILGYRGHLIKMYPGRPIELIMDFY